MAIFVYPRWPSAAILDFIDPQIAAFEMPIVWVFVLVRDNNTAGFVGYLLHFHVAELFAYFTLSQQ